VFLAEVASAQRKPRDLRRFTGRGRRNAAKGFRAPGVSTAANGTGSIRVQRCSFR